MKILKIENGIGYFYSFDLNKYLEIDKIDRKSLLEMINYVLKNEGCETDVFSEELIDNKAQKIVYKDLEAKLRDLIGKRQSILDEIDSKYKAALEKYSNPSSESQVETENG